MTRTLIIATGGASYKTTGSDGRFFHAMTTFKEDAKIVNLRPCLVPIYVENYQFSELSGISFNNASMTVFKRAANKKIYRKGALLLTHKCFSGPLILDASRYIETGDKISLCFDAELSYEKFLKKLLENSNGTAKTTITLINDTLKELGIVFPQRFLEAAMNCAFPPKYRTRKAAELPKNDFQMLAKTFTEMAFTVSGLGSFKEAMCTSGGLSLSEIDVKTMEWLPNIHVIGEALDVDGDTGGYNLQFAYSSAAAAAEHIKNIL